MDDIEQLLPVGTVLQDRYRIDQQLASGGFGKTYAVTDIRFDEKWAMKEFFMKGITERSGNAKTIAVVAASMSQFESQREKFKKEARRLRKQNHPGIVHVQDLFDENGTSYYVMDYIGGGSLAETISRQGPFTEQRVRQLLPYLLDALEHVHEQKIWHLDLKPGNILLKDDGTPVLIDFGASKQMGQAGAPSTSTGMAFTQGYAPSEQVDQNFDRIGPWTDLYALGATLYNLLTGHTPPLGSEIQEVENAAFNFTPGISEQMRSLILWMMNPNRRKRPQSVDQVRSFLKLKAPLEEIKKPIEDDKDGTQLSDPPADVPTVKRTVSPPADVPTVKRTADSKLSVKDATSPIATPASTGFFTRNFKAILTVVPIVALFCLLFLVWPKQLTESPDLLTQSTEKPDVLTQSTDEPDVLTQTTDEPDVLTQTTDEPDVLTQTTDEPDVLTELTESPEVMTFTANGVEIKMVRVEGGTFTMGATTEQGSDVGSDEQPAHRVTLSKYYIGETEVTQAQWQAVMGSNPSNFKGDSRPVENVSWDDCQTFVSRLNAATGQNFRLPTEAEWEYAARGGNRSQGYKYSGGNTLGSVAWYADNSGDETHAVKTKSPNELGIYDMSGNVWEWCQDWYGSYSDSAQTNPHGRPSKGYYRVDRGGSWNYFAECCRVSLRNRLTPGVRRHFLGLRLAL